MVEKFIPSSKCGALDILSKHDCYILAGGSDLMVMKKNTAGLAPKFDKDVLYLSHVDELKGIYEDEAGVHIKSMTTLDDVLMNKLTPTLLKKAVSQVASSNIRHFATLVGNLANASPAGDTIVVDILLDAKVKLESVKGERIVNAEDFILGVRKIDRHPDELVTELIFPNIEYDGDMWWKVGSRKADSISKVMVAGYYEKTGKIISKFALSFGSVSSKAIRSHEIEKEIIGMEAYELSFRKKEIIDKYSKVISPIDDQRSNKEYRQKVAMNIVSEFIDQVVKGGK